MEKISIIVPCRNEEKYITEFIDSIIDNDYPKELMEILIIDGKSTDDTASIVKRYTNRYSFIRLLINENRTVPFALNMGIKISNGDYIIRLDAHSKIPTNYFSELVKWAKTLDADNIGTICITDVKNKTPKSNAIKKVLSSKFGVGNSFFRIGIDNIKEVDTVPFGCYKKEVFNKIGIFNENLERNQDIELNKRILRNGGIIYLLGNISSIYFARENFLEFAKNNFATGKWNVLTVYLTKRFDSLSLRHFIPLIFILSLILPILSTIFFSSVWLVSVASFVSYMVLLSIISLMITDKSTSFLQVLLAFMILHFSYGFGSLVGLFRLNYLHK